MSAATEKTIEIVTENVDEVVDGVIEVVEVVRNSTPVLLATLVVGVSGGAGLGYLIAKKILASRFDDTLVQEITTAKEFYANLNKVNLEGANLSPKDVLVARHGEDAVEAMRSYQGRDVLDDLDADVGEPVFEGEPHDDVQDDLQLAKIQELLTNQGAKEGTINVFSDDTFDLAEELKHRTDERPYIITHDEYFAADVDYDNHSLVYYAGDDTLCDEHEKPLEDTDVLVGDDHLVRFGSGSKDKNIVYVRNTRLEIDYEIVRVEGTYLELVLGMEAKQDRELRHSADARRAFRRGEG